MATGLTKAVRIRRKHLAGPGQISRDAQDQVTGQRLPHFGGRWGLRAAAALVRGECLASTGGGSEASLRGTDLPVSEYVRELLMQERSKLPLSETVLLCG